MVSINRDTIKFNKKKSGKFKMAENITTIEELKTGQKKTTVPKAIAGAMKLKGKDQLEWLFAHGDVIVRKV